MSTCFVCLFVCLFVFWWRLWRVKTVQFNFSSTVWILSGGWKIQQRKPWGISRSIIVPCMALCVAAFYCTGIHRNKEPYTYISCGAFCLHFFSWKGLWNGKKMSLWALHSNVGCGIAFPSCDILLILSTVNSRLADTSLLRTPHLYGQLK